VERARDGKVRDAVLASVLVDVARFAAARRERRGVRAGVADLALAWPERLVVRAGFGGFALAVPRCLAICCVCVMMPSPIP
jgi:hypothetical protein